MREAIEVSITGALLLALLVAACIALQIVALIHEWGHAVAAQYITKAETYIEIGGGLSIGGSRVARRINSAPLVRWLRKYRRAPQWLPRILGLRRADVWMCVWPVGGRCGHEPITSNRANIWLYRAGYIATLSWALVLALLAGLLVRFSVPGAMVLSVAFAVLVVLLLFSSVENRWLVREPRPTSDSLAPRGTNGSDAYYLKRLKSERDWIPPAPYTAARIRALRETR